MNPPKKQLKPLQNKKKVLEAPGKMRREVAAGGIVFKKTRRGILFAMIVDSYGKLAFPKGHVRRGERLSETAVREVCEELGLCELELLRRLGTNDIWFRDRFVYKGYLIHKYIHYFLFQANSNARVRVEVKEGNTKGEQIQKGLWVPMYDVLKRSSYENMEPIVKAAIRSIEKRYNLKPTEKHEQKPKQKRKIQAKPKEGGKTL